MDINRYSPSYGVSKKHMLRLKDFSTEELFEFLYATKAMKAKFIAHESTEILKGVTVALLFGDTSIRTRAALEIGIRQLGGYCVNLPYNEKDMLAGENIKDIVCVISRFGAGALVTRGINDRELQEFCKVSDDVSIINSTNREYIPVQALCDIFTIWEKKGRLEGLKLAYIGKGGNNAASLIMGGIKCGMEISVATPKEFPIYPDHVQHAEQYGKIFVTENPVEAVRGADIVYTDNYGYHNPPSEADKEILKPYQVNNNLLNIAQHNALFMHSLPATRGLEVTADVIDGKQSVILDQGENKLHTIKAVLALLIK